MPAMMRRVSCTCVTQPIDVQLQTTVNAAGTGRMRPWPSIRCVKQQTINSLCCLHLSCKPKFVASLLSLDTRGCAPVENYEGGHYFCWRGILERSPPGLLSRPRCGRKDAQVYPGGLRTQQRAPSMGSGGPGSGENVTVEVHPLKDC